MPNETSTPRQLPDAGGGGEGESLDIQIGLTLFAVICFVLSLVGNATVIHIIRTRRHMRNVTNILISNMSVADLLMTLLVFPYLCKYYFVGPRWFGGVMGTITCKIVHSSQMISIFCSVFTLLVISVDRCLAVMRPMKRPFTKTIIKWCIGIVWLISVVFSIPLIIAMKVINKDSMYLCIEDWTDTGMSSRDHVVTFMFLTYILPLLFIGSAYGVTGRKLWGSERQNPLNRSNHRAVRATRRKATKMLITVVVLFALCWFPLQIRELIHVSAPGVSKAFPRKLDFALPWFGFANSCINPYIYLIFSVKFRQEFKRVLCVWLSDEDFQPFTNAGSPMIHTRAATRVYNNLANNGATTKTKDTSV